MQTPLQSHILIIGGMHRSGTTFTARWLQQSGLFIGDILLKSKFSHANPAGDHYEDKDFLTLHRQILSANGLSRDGYITDETIHIAPAFCERARSIVATRQHHHCWGWKEPRTCLFLDFWQSILPDAYLLVIYRHYAQVADSLLRRKLDHPKRFRRWFYRLTGRDYDTSAAHYISIWNRYNRDLLDYANRTPERTLILRIDDLAQYSVAVIQYLNEKWGFDLNHYSAQAVFEKNRLRQSTSYVNLETHRVAQAAKTAEPTYQALEDWRNKTIEILTDQVNTDG